MTIAAIVLAVIYAALAGTIGVYAQRCARGQLPFQHRMGLPGSALRRGETGWRRGHAASATLLGTAAIICLIQAMTLALAVSSAGLLSLGYILTIAIVGAVLVGMLLILATRNANKAAG